MSSSPHQVLEKRFEIVYTHITSRVNITPLWRKWTAVEGAKDRFKKVFMQGIHPELKPLLAAAHPPDINDLANIGFDSRKDLFGVYLKILVSKSDAHHNHLYVGSATGAAGLGDKEDNGLRGRRKQHEYDLAKNDVK
jgi:hypothetical protein